MTVDGKRIAGAIGMAAVVIVAAVYLSGGSVPIARDSSPDGRWQLELDGPNRWQRLTGRGANMPATARLVEARTGQAGSRSPLFELSGTGEVFWEEGGVQIGSSATFDGADDTWAINQ